VSRASSQPPQEVREYVRENRDMLAHVLRHGDDLYARACAYALLVRGGDKPDVEKVKRELERAEEMMGR
jgi:hypothetical protein